MTDPFAVAARTFYCYLVPDAQHPGEHYEIAITHRRLAWAVRSSGTGTLYGGEHTGAMISPTSFSQRVIDGYYAYRSPDDAYAAVCAYAEEHALRLVLMPDSPPTDDCTLADMARTYVFAVYANVEQDITQEYEVTMRYLALDYGGGKGWGCELHRPRSAAASDAPFGYLWQDGTLKQPFCSCQRFGSGMLLSPTREGALGNLRAYVGARGMTLVVEPARLKAWPDQHVPARPDTHPDARHEVKIEMSTPMGEKKPAKSKRTSHR